MDRNSIWANQYLIFDRVPPDRALSWTRTNTEWILSPLPLPLGYEGQANYLLSDWSNISSKESNVSESDKPNASNNSE